MLADFPDKSAQAVCTFAYSEGPGHEPIIFQGRTNVSCLPYGFTISNILQGKIVPARGPSRFGKPIATLALLPFTDCPGWDPIFEYEGQT